MKYRIIKKPVNPGLIGSKDAYFPQSKGLFLWHSFYEFGYDEKFEEVSFKKFEDAENFLEQEIPRKYSLNKKIVIYEV